MTPYLRHFGPPAFVAMLPPRELFLRLAGSGGVVQAARPRRRLEVARDDPWLDHGNEVALVQFQEAVHPREGKRHAAPRGHAAADVAVPGPARRDGNPLNRAEAQHRRHVLRGPSEDDGFRRVAGEPLVARVRGEDRGIVGHDAAVRIAEQAAEGGSERHGNGFVEGGV